MERLNQNHMYDVGVGQQQQQNELEETRKGWKSAMH